MTPRPPKRKLRDAAWLTSKQVCERLNISYLVFINRTHARWTPPVAQVGSRYYWREDQLKEIGMTDAEWYQHFDTIPRDEWERRREKMLENASE